MPSKSATTKKSVKRPATKTPARSSSLQKAIEAVLDQMFDPEIPVSIWQLGLIYEIKIDKSKNVDILMTLTSPSCPVAGSLPRDVMRRVNAIDGVKRARVEVTFDPAWTPERMSEAAKFELGML